MPVENPTTTRPEPPEVEGSTKPKPKSTSVSTGRTAPTEATKSQVKVVEVDEDAIPQSYVWLANGDVKLCNDEDLPGTAGSGNPFGHWIEDGKVFQVVAVYPKEEKAEE